jgi:hypothetical protein
MFKGIAIALFGISIFRNLIGRSSMAAALMLRSGLCGRSAEALGYKAPHASASFITPARATATSSPVFQPFGPSA